MKRSKQILLCLFVIWTCGCSSPSPATESVNAFMTKTPSIQSTTTMPTSQLQITYIQNDDNFGELYASDVNCMTQEPMCFSEPRLLFTTLTMPTSDQSWPRGLLTDYSWSAEGNRIALVSVGDILIGDLNKHNWTNITNSSDVDEYQPAWSHDGNAIYYRACPRTADGIYGGHSACGIYSSDLTGNVKFTFLGSQSDYYDSYDVSPDGQKIVFALADTQGYDQIYQANLDGSENHQITAGQINNSSPSFSPDGKKMIYVRINEPNGANSPLQSDLILKDLETGEEKILTKQFDGDVFTPVFAPDGNWVAFTSFDTSLNANIFVLSIDDGIWIQVTYTNHAVSPSWRLSVKP